MIRAALNAARARPCSNRFSVLGSTNVYELDSESNHVHIPVLLTGKTRQKEVVAMVDSGATNTFISRRFIRENHVATRKLKHPILLFNIDGTENKDGSITELALLQMKIRDHMEKVAFSVTDIGPEDLIIGLDWLRKHNPDINWETGLLQLSRCTDCCRAATKTILTKEPKTLLTKKQKRQAQPKGRVVGKVMDRDEGLGLGLEDWDEQMDAQLLRAGTTWTEKHEQKLLKTRPQVKVEDFVPEQYNEFLDVFSEEKSHTGYMQYTR